jgi:hypothetical protein
LCFVPGSASEAGGAPAFFVPDLVVAVILVGMRAGGTEYYRGFKGAIQRWEGTAGSLQMRRGTFQQWKAWCRLQGDIWWNSIDST